MNAALTRWVLVAAAGAVAMVPRDVAAQSAGSSGGLGDLAARHLPLVEMPAKTAGHTLAVVLSGDGDWAATIRGISRSLSDSGMAVVGLKSRSYLAHERQPDEVARDVELLARHYLAEWKRDTLVFVGFSRGADMMAFVINRLPADLRARTTLVALLSPSRRANFQFHMIDLLRDVERSSDRFSRPEVARARADWPSLRLLCVYGADEAPSSLCTEAPALMTWVVSHPGGHAGAGAEVFSDDIAHALRLRVGAPNVPHPSSNSLASLEPGPAARSLPFVR
jgi:type IV secretory pathway VirJ component